MVLVYVNHIGSSFRILGGGGGGGGGGRGVPLYNRVYGAAPPERDRNFMS